MARVFNGGADAAWAALRLCRTQTVVRIGAAQTPGVQIDSLAHVPVLILARGENDGRWRFGY